MDKIKTIASINKFSSWIHKNGYLSQDQYDLWSTAYGIFSKRVYYSHRAIGIPLVAPVFALEIFMPWSRKFFTTKKRFPIADAHLISGYLNLYKTTSDRTYLTIAENISDDLLKQSIKGYSGHCWGYPFNWMTTRGLWTSGVPLITTTPYCYESYIDLFEATGKSEYNEIAFSTFLFALRDINDVKTGMNISVCSYSPIDSSQIINANAYRAFMLVDGGNRFNNHEAIEIAKRNINFILANQNSDGSWLYAANDKLDSFVDNFHTCFVLKNLIKINRYLGDPRISGAIKNGFKYYKNNLIAPDYSPIPFARLRRFNFVKKELYDYAEGILLCLQLIKDDPDASQILEKLVSDVTNKYQKPDGSFISSINILNLKNKTPYLRWAQSQLFFALTSCLTINID